MLFHRIPPLALLSLMLAWCLPSAANEPKKAYDIVIYGGTSAGVVASVQAAMMGKSAVLIEPGEHLGGLSSGGLGWTDSGDKRVIGGLAREFYRRIKRHYDRTGAWKWEPAEKYTRYQKNADTMWTFEPHVAENLFDEWVRAEGIDVLRNERLAENSGVEKRGTQIIAIQLVSGLQIAGQIFIDCTYEGDLLAAAGVTYVVGRESNDQYHENINGVAGRLSKYHQFEKPVSPYLTPGDPTSGLLFGIEATGPGKEGAGDKRVQAYNFRLCITDIDGNRVPFTKPVNYDEQLYELLLRNFEAGDMRLPLHMAMLPNRKTDTNNNFAVSTDFIGQNYDYPDGGYATREKIIAAHENYTKGLMWTLAYHPRVPESIRKRMSKWGWAKDEFPKTGNFPHQMYVREARRMVGDFVMTERHLHGAILTPKPVGMGSYMMDSHHVQRYVTPKGTVRNEGDVQVRLEKPYPIGYEALIPKADECENLIVPVCLSSSHMAFGSIRMEPVFMILGQSAATAAVIAIDDGVPVQEIDYERLRHRLLSDGQILE